MRHGRNSCSWVLMYTSPSVLQCARTVTIDLFRKTGWPDRAWWLWSSTATTSLTNFTSLGVIRPENRSEIVSVYNLQWVVQIPRADAAAVLGEANPSQPQSEAATRHCHSRTGPTVPLGQRTGPSATACRVGALRRVEVSHRRVLVKGGVLIQKKELSGHNWRNRKDPPKAETWTNEVQP